jgi:hypothetical protein
MFRMIGLVFVLAAACGSKVPYNCTATVTGTGTSADGTYACTVPPNGNYSTITQAGSITGFATSPIGVVSFSLTMKGEPAAATYTDATLPAQGAYDVTVTASGSSRWRTSTGGGSFTLTVNDLNFKSTQGVAPGQVVWPHVSGTLTATLDPLSGSAATTKATVTMIF